MQTRRVFAFLGAAGMITGGLVAATAAPALASCSHAHSDKDSTVGYITGTDAGVRPGPHYISPNACTPVYYALRGYAAEYQCYTTGDTYQGWSTWTWAYVPALGRSGWINDYLLSGNGSNYAC
ncbi:hypothetical protein [Actinoplanes couchii]|uniref:SH3b domain-containing protein n=1 Tax=Actinoplanes couchii TaxID=403638 RepID=A0ABQ3XPG9_9ACTN|nr:hypothetical protein [Actinoplanes couchii]MDR6319060.1 hypothetical protein [Actinoplanes couchii]GID60402.1 hypothetical protein Aco03nite_088060 [Actinoplanes couchii]